MQVRSGWITPTAPRCGQRWLFPALPDDHLDLDFRAHRQTRNLNGRARWIWLRYVLGIDAIHRLKLAEIGQLANIPEKLIDYRQHFSSANRAKNDEQRRLKLQIVSEAAARRGIDPPKESDLIHFTEMSRGKQHCVWGWAVLKNGKSDIARRHAYRAIRAAPTSVEAWKLMFCSLRGR